VLEYDIHTNDGKGVDIDGGSAAELKGNNIHDNKHDSLRSSCSQ
jgi:hypothetical protein